MHADPSPSSESRVLGLLTLSETGHRDAPSTLPPSRGLPAASGMRIPYTSPDISTLP